MKHFSTYNVTSIVVRNIPSPVFREEMCDAFVLAVGLGTYKRNFETQIEKFVFDGDREAGSWLYKWTTPAEFKAVVSLKVWYKGLMNDMKHRSPSYWTRTADYVYVNLNSGRSIVFIDGHYWD